MVQGGATWGGMGQDEGEQGRAGLGSCSTFRGRKEEGREEEEVDMKAAGAIGG